MVNPKSAPKRKVDEKDTRVNNVGGSKAGIKNLRNRNIAITALQTVVTDQPVKKKGNVKDAVKKIAKKVQSVFAIQRTSTRIAPKTKKKETAETVEHVPATSIEEPSTSRAHFADSGSTS